YQHSQPLRAGDGRRAAVRGDRRLRREHRPSQRDRARDAAGRMNAFRWSAADAYLFDIDGTLLNSRDGVHYNAFNNAVRRFFGVSSKIDGVPVHGNTDPGIIRAVLEREGVNGAELEAKLPLLV